ncbi:hypothetical protein [Clostridium sp.]
MLRSLCNSNKVFIGQFVKGMKYDVVILDELTIALYFKLIDLVTEMNEVKHYYNKHAYLSTYSAL